MHMNMRSWVLHQNAPNTTMKVSGRTPHFSFHLMYQSYISKLTMNLEIMTIKFVLNDCF